jgi:hypothetical protein
MRDSEKPASLGELLGSAASEQDLSLKDLPKLLGEKMPDMPKNRIGKFRLLNALQQRFGPGYKNIPMVGKIIKEFDDEVEVENVIRRNKKGK